MPAVEHRPDVTVVLPTYRGAGRIGACLASLAGQTLDHERFEVVVVVNGPPDDTAAVVAATRERHPGLVLRTVTLAEPGVGRARNVGLAAARGRFTTFVDDDDSVSPGFLLALLERSDERTVGLALLANIAGPGSAPDFQAGSTPWQLARREAVVPAHELPGALGYTAAKMLPTALAREVGFDPSLPSGEDVAFWGEAFARSRFAFGLCPADAHAVYYRALRPESVSRQDLSFDFNVTQRLDVIARLHEALDRWPSEAAEHALSRLRLGQLGFLNRYLRQHPDDYQRVLEDIRERGMEDLPVDRVRDGAGRELAVLYVALPYADTSALVAARRIRARGVLVDVLSSDMSSVRGRDESAELIWCDYVDQRAEIPTRPTDAWWPGIMDFCRKGMAQIERWQETKEPYRRLYSRSMLPASHVLAAQYKARYPDVEWVAELSDPLLLDIHAEQRPSHGVLDPAYRQELEAAFATRGLRCPDGDSVHHWAEALVYALADTVVFTNDNQRRVMLDYCPDADLAQRAAIRSTVAAHPTVPRWLYEAVPSPYPLDPDRVHVAYFGIFYATRGLTEVVGALHGLSPQDRERLRLHVFTSKPADLATELRESGLDDVVIVNPYVSYLEFLNLTTRFDVLLVNDARTSGAFAVNPYLPSKWSDYAGSGTSVWAIVEEGSVLSGQPAAYRTVLGDVAAAQAVLEQLAGTRASVTVGRDASGAP